MREREAVIDNWRKLFLKVKLDTCCCRGMNNVLLKRFILNRN